MRVLFWYCKRIAWTPTHKALPQAEDLLDVSGTSATDVTAVGGRCA